MDSLETALIIVLSINLMLVIGQIAGEKINPGFAEQIINCENSPLGQYGNCSSDSFTFDASNPILPTTQASVDSTTGAVFTDLWNTIKGFFSDTLGLKYVVMLVSGPKSFLTSVGLDDTFAGLIGAVWWIVTTLLIISYIKR